LDIDFGKVEGVGAVAETVLEGLDALVDIAHGEEGRAEAVRVLGLLVSAGLIVRL
jgi:hypothetical protein